MFVQMLLLLLPPTNSARYCRVEGHLQGLSDTNAYNVLRLRTEDEWITYCSRWQKSNADGERC